MPKVKLAIQRPDFTWCTHDEVTVYTEPEIQGCVARYVELAQDLRLLDFQVSIDGHVELSMDDKQPYYDHRGIRDNLDAAIALRLKTQ